MKRRFFQIHLLTAVVGMLTMAACLGLNLQVFREGTVYWLEASPQTKAALFGAHTYWMGWPARIAEEPWHRSKYDDSKPDYRYMKLRSAANVNAAPITLVQLARMDRVPRDSVDGPLASARFASVQRLAPDVVPEIRWVQAPAPLPAWDVEWNWKNIAMNAAVAVVVTLAAMFGIEWFLRRRERANV